MFRNPTHYFYSNNKKQIRGGNIMSTEKTSKGLVGAGILSALAASLCCITPVLALIAGSSGLASTFSWLEPARPYFMGITVLVLGFAWYQKLKPRKADDIACDCDEEEKTPFMQTKLFLGIVTAFAIIMTAFPYYSSIFYPKNESNVVLVDPANVEEASFTIDGMTCTSCEEHIKYSIAKLPGYIEAEASYEQGNATVKFDKSKSTIDEVVAAINETGYTVSDFKVTKNK